MAVTEIALLRLKSGVSPQDQDLLKNLQKGINAMCLETNSRFSFYRSLDDESLFYIVGSWPSVAYHMEGWIPSHNNQELLKSTNDFLEVPWMFHLDCYPSTVPFDSRQLTLIQCLLKEEVDIAPKSAYATIRPMMESMCTASDRLTGGPKIEDNTQGVGKQIVFIKASSGKSDNTQGNVAQNLETIDAIAKVEIHNIEKIEVDLRE